MNEIEHSPHFLRWCTIEDRKLGGKMLVKYMCELALNADPMNFD